MAPRMIEVYTLEELKEKHPDAYAKVYEKWRNHVMSYSTPWADETMDSLKAVFEKCSFEMLDYSLGAYSPSYIRARPTYNRDDEEESTPGTDREWFLDNVLLPLGHVREDGTVHFPGNLALTGYCADDDFLEHVWQRLEKGDTLKEALESLAGVASKMMEDDLEQQAEEDSMLANWDHREYTADGVCVKR